ncbi:MAG: hypothetical protein R3B95_02895 [Nitrospirales bacterium]|nr:hypothetical protein [Nitrospirales bacterium]
MNRYYPKLSPEVINVLRRRMNRIDCGNVVMSFMFFAGAGMNRLSAGVSVPNKMFPAGAGMNLGLGSNNSSLRYMFPQARG